MPLPEMYDYIKLINDQTKKENEEMTKWKTSNDKQEKPKMFSDVFKNMGNPLK